MMDQRVTQSGFQLFAIILMLHSLAAYAVGPVPFPWLAQVLAIFIFLYVGVRSKFRIAPGMAIFMLFFVYAVIVTLYQSAVGDYYNYLPPKATTAYLPYITLRFFTMASFGAVFFATYWLISRGQRERLIRYLAFLCLFISAAAIYIYIAQLYGLPEPPRTRVGTSGGEQSVKFTYAFHRALGTFREPSHLAEWLVLPLFMSFARPGLLFYSARALGVTVLFLTGSLTGIAAVLGGLGGSFVVMAPFLNSAVIKSVTRMVGMGAIGLLAFSLMVGGSGGPGEDKKAGLVDVLWKRVEPMLESDQGAKASNRNYVYDYVDTQEMSWFGDGLGNSNLKFTQAVNLDATASFLNLFVNFAMSLGYLGLTLFGVFLLMPLFILFLNTRYKFEQDHYLIAASYIGWIIVFIAHSEELSFHFGITYALLIHAFSQKRASVQVKTP